MDNKEKAEKLEKLIEKLAEDVKSFVEQTESGLKTTQNNYGVYGAMLSRLSEGNQFHAQILAKAMKRAGANVQGVNDGLQTFC